MEVRTNGGAGAGAGQGLNDYDGMMSSLTAPPTAGATATATATATAPHGAVGNHNKNKNNKKMMMPMTSPLYGDEEEAKEEVLAPTKSPGAVPVPYTDTYSHGHGNGKNNHHDDHGDHEDEDEDEDDAIKKKMLANANTNTNEGNTRNEGTGGGSGGPSRLTDGSRSKSRSSSSSSSPPPEESMQNTKQTKQSGADRRRRGEKNPLFQEVETTGAWGSISNTEKIIAAVILFLVLAGVIGAILRFVVFRDNNNNNLPPRPPPPTMAPSLFPENDPTLQLAALLQAIQNNSVVSSTLTTSTATSSSADVVLPNDVSYYAVDKVMDDTVVPAMRAMSWILTEDTRDEAPDSVWLIPRFILATLYFSTTGLNWNNHSHWLSQEHACDWYGVYCDRFRDTITELDLNSNNLKGSIPAALGLLSSLQGLVLTTNRLTGTPPFGALGTLPRLSFLFLDNNQLTGTINPAVRANGVLTTLMVQRNAFSGTWPSDFCDGQIPLVQKYGLDCQEVDVSACFCCSNDLDYSCF